MALALASLHFGYTGSCNAASKAYKNACACDADAEDPIGSTTSIGFEDTKASCSGVLHGFRQSECDCENESTDFGTFSVPLLHWAAPDGHTFYTHDVGGTYGTNQAFREAPTYLPTDASQFVSVDDPKNVMLTIEGGDISDRNTERDFTVTVTAKNAHNVTVQGSRTYHLRHFPGGTFEYYLSRSMWFVGPNHGANTMIESYFGRDHVIPTRGGDWFDGGVHVDLSLGHFDIEEATGGEPLDSINKQHLISTMQSSPRGMSSAQARWRRGKPTWRSSI